MQFSQSGITSIQFAPGQVDTLGVFTAPSSAAPQYNVVALNTYNGIMVVISNPVSTIPAIGWYAQVTNISAGVHGIFSGAFPCQPTTAALAVPQYEVILGCANNINDTLGVTIVFNNVPPSGTIIAIYGLTGAINRAVRPDGRNCPVGMFNGATALLTSNGPSNIIAAPPTATRIMLKSAQVANGTAGGAVLATINVTMNGASVVLLQVLNAPSANVQGWESGILLDPGTAVTLSGSGTPVASAQATYDLVPA